MKINIDTDNKTITCIDDGITSEVPFYSDEAFKLISDQWVNLGWNQKYVYTFSWFGRPIIQLPEDMIRTQEIIWQLQPDVILETGIAHGGSLIFYASLCKAIGNGRVIGVDIDIRQHNKEEIESHPLFNLITLIEGSSIAPETVSKVFSLINNEEKVLVILDSNHTKDHVSAELEAYHSLVSKGSYIVATDGIMESVYDTPRGHNHWKTDNPSTAAVEFAEQHSEFIIETPNLPFNESTLTSNFTHWPNAWLKRC
jgi:cephalosporin hydroxylase